MPSFLGSYIDISMRSNNHKEIEAIDLDQLFEEYVETDLLQQYSNGSTDPSSSNDLAYLFDLAPANGDDGLETRALPDRDASEDAWHKAIQQLEQNAASPVPDDSSLSIYPESGGKASLSDPVLCSFDDIFDLESIHPQIHTQPSTPKPHLVKPARKARSSPDRPTRPGIHKSSHKRIFSSVSGKMMGTSQLRPTVPDIWTRRMDHAAADAFNLQMPPTGIHSPPPSAKLLQEDDTNGFFPRGQQPYTIAMSPLTAQDSTTPEIQQPGYQLTPLSSPTIEAHSRNGTASSLQFSNDGLTGAYNLHQLNSAALSALQTPPASHRLPFTAWGSDASPNMDFSSFSASSDFQSTTPKTSGWWNNGPGSSLPVTQPDTPSPYHSSHPRSGSGNMDYTTASVAGLGISSDSSSFSGFATDSLPPSASFDIAAYTSVYPPTTPGIPIGHTPANPPSDSRSPSLSPQPRFTRRRHSSQNHAANPHSHHGSARQSHSRRKSSNSSSHSAGRAAAASQSVGFVNFTPDDSRKILTGVAPSGSSKTKARREKEAAEKRRKLSQAAVKAVMEAGGDLGRLEKEGLLALEG